MSVRIQLQHPHSSFTNLDEIQGQVFLSLVSQETITAITVKLEGESRTRLAGTIGGLGTYDSHRRDPAQLEVHKLLYKVLTVFPTPDVMRIPFNNDCINNLSLLASLSPMRMDLAPGAHVKKSLPPTLSGLPGEAEIQYYVKATVQRPAFYKENFRAHANFMFLPIEPPRPPANRRESYARVQHQFAPVVDSMDKPGLFRRSSTSNPSASVNPPSVSVEGRLPDPAIITCNEAVPLRMLVTKLNHTTATLYMQMISVELLAFTSIRAHQIRKNEVSSWTIISKSNMQMPLNEGMDSGNANSKILEVDSKLWKQMPLPNTVSPTFHTCNVSRTYALHIKLGLSWGAGNKVNPELTVQVLRMPVRVYSGIAPSQALLAAMSNRISQSAAQGVPPSIPPRPPAPNGSSPSYPQPTLAQTTDHIEPAPGDIPSDAPPSYEDAIADNMGPIDGPRREYRQSESMGEKGGGRLFQDSGT
ncbi:MAG: hypothetical protein Q9163_000546 [Psora crenata]